MNDVVLNAVSFGRVLNAERYSSDEESVGKPQLSIPIALWSAASKSNSDTDRNILKDLSGNGHDIILEGFFNSPTSGYGGFNMMLLDSSIIDNRFEYTYSYNKVTYRRALEDGSYLASIPKENIGTGKQLISLTNTAGKTIYISTGVDVRLATIKEDGVYELDLSKVSGGVTISRSYDANEDMGGLTIEMLPVHPGSLVFDGYEDYGVCSNLPLLQEYTVIAKRSGCSGGCVASKSGNRCFVFDGDMSVSYGAETPVALQKDGWSWQTSDSYNGTPISRGVETDDSELFYVGYNPDDGSYMKGAIECIYLFDRILDTTEINNVINSYRK